MSDAPGVTLPDGVRLHVETSGPAGAPLTVVLLHGWCLDTRTWHHQQQALAALDDRPRVIAYDARGHGRSGSTRLRSATLRQLGDDLSAVLSELAPEGPVVFAGHSLGAMTVMEYAAANPDEFRDRVAGMLLVNTTAEGHTHTRYGLPPQLSQLLRPMEMIGAGVLARSGAWRPHQLLRPALQPVVRWLLFGDTYQADALTVTMQCFGSAPLRSIGGFRSSIGAQKRLETLASMGGVPTAVLTGSRDRLTPPAAAESIAAALPGAELTVCPGAGHMLPLECPELVSEALTTIVRQAAEIQDHDVVAGRVAQTVAPAEAGRGPS